jgi:hypothetical protein
MHRKNGRNYHRLLAQFEHSPQKPTQQSSSEFGVSKMSVHNILKGASLKAYIPLLLHALNKDDFDHRTGLCR